jgi:hypothetical protein
MKNQGMGTKTDFLRCDCPGEVFLAQAWFLFYNTSTTL